MRILVAEDDPVSSRLLESHLRKWGHEIVIAQDGMVAWETLQLADAPEIAVVDWMMSGLDGVELCRRARGRASTRPLYIILLTVRTKRQDIVEGLDAGADDYITKPYDPAELRARIRVGVRMVELQSELARRVEELEQAFVRVDQLHGILPICSYCKKVRSDGDSWQQVESYVAAHSAARFSHGVCPDCLKNVMRPELEEMRRTRAVKKDRPKS